MNYVYTYKVFFSSILYTTQSSISSVQYFFSYLNPLLFSTGKKSRFEKILLRCCDQQKNKQYRLTSHYCTFQKKLQTYIRHCFVVPSLHTDKLFIASNLCTKRYPYVCITILDGNIDLSNAITMFNFYLYFETKKNHISFIRLESP